jgi:hypothetical protein
MEVPITASIDPENIQGIGELWKSVYEYAKAQYEDNQLYNSKYPIETRRTQMVALNSLIDAINKFHKEAGTIKRSMKCKTCSHVFVGTDSFEDRLSIKTTGMCRECVKLFGQW